MPRSRKIALLGLALFAAFVIVLALRNRRPPPLPPDAAHVWENADACLECHGPGEALAQQPNHPVGRDCARCHGSATESR